MKRFLVSDDYGNYKELMGLKDLKALLISELSEDTMICYEDDNKDGVKYNIDLFTKLAKEEITFELLEEQLSSFGWYVQDIFELQQGINNLREFYARKHADLKVFDDMLKLLDEGEL